MQFLLKNRAFRLGMAAVGGLGLLGTFTVATQAQNRSQVVNVYSGRHYNTDKELYAQFTRQTGIRVNLIEGKDDEMIERLRREGAAIATATGASVPLG